MGAPKKKDYGIWGSKLGSPYVGKLQNQWQAKQIPWLRKGSSSVLGACRARS